MNAWESMRECICNAKSLEALFPHEVFLNFISFPLFFDSSILVVCSQMINTSNFIFICYKLLQIQHQRDLLI